MLLLVPSTSASAGTLHQWFWNESFTSADQNVRSDSQGLIPTDRTYCFAYGMGAKKLNQATPWPVADFTGFQVPQPVSTFQRGVSDSWYGSTACQLNGTRMGFQVHKDSVVQNNPISAPGNIYGMQMIRNWGSDLSRRPWGGSFSPAAALRIQANYTVPRRYTPAGVAQYGQLVVSLVDTTQNDPSYSRAIWYSISLWDSRGPQGEWVATDAGGTPNYVVNTFVGATKYATAHPNSQTAWGNSGCACLWYGAYISKANLLNAVRDLNSRFGRHYSTNAADWAINLVGVGTEMMSPPGSMGWIASSAWELGAFTEY